MTDPALEFSNLASSLRTFARGDNQPTIHILAQFLGIDKDDTQLFELIGFIASRSVRLRDFIQNLQDEYLDEETRAELLSTLNNITQIISPSRMQTPWQQLSGSYLHASQIVQLKQFSQTARRYRPLRAVTPEEKKDIAKKIEEALVELEDNKDLPPWTVNLIKDGLLRLSLMIKHLHIFGHEAVIDHLIGLCAEIGAASQTLAEKGKTIAGKFWKTAVVISAGLGILVAPIKAQEAYIGYKAYALKIMDNPPALLAPP